MTLIVLADDHLVVRQGIRALLEAVDGFRVVGETGDGLEVADLVVEQRPDVLVVDLMMPGLNGLEIIRTVRKLSPETKILVLSMHADDSYVLMALKKGASGYVLKESSSTELVQAINEVYQGRRFLSPRVSDRVIDVFIHTLDEVTDPFDTLTPREREVLQLLAEGHTIKSIGERLSISPRTVETHRNHVFEKLGLRSQTDLVKFTLKRGIIDLDG